MSANPEQYKLNLDGPENKKPEMVEVKVEADEDKECGACGNLLASRSRGCPQCSNNEIKKRWQNDNPQKISH